ncbi:hypothetical protein D5086_011740 [Populus alba]|uniref:Uncharacterized protein n=1 Tax=Populus alba TaxID=43335 RepID=A0ACC4CEP1_POPAL
MATASALALLLLAILSPFRNVSAVGVSYGTLGKNFPSPSTDTSAADEWFTDRVMSFIPVTSIVPLLLPSNEICMAVLASSFPPSVSTFATALMPVMTSIVGFLADTGAPYMVNAYPYFAYRDNRGETAATPDNAKTHNTRLVERAQSSKGTPTSLKENIQKFVFALFNEKEGGQWRGIRFGEKMSSGVSGPSVRWCIAKPHANEKVLQAVLDLFCGPGGVGCREIYVSGDCFAPDKLHAHASYALNAYYQMHGRNHVLEL